MVTVTLTRHANQSHNKGKEADKMEVASTRGGGVRGPFCSAAAKFILSESLNKIEGKSRRVHGPSLIPEAVQHFFCDSGRIHCFFSFSFLFLKVLRLLCVSNTLS